MPFLRSLAAGMAFAVLSGCANSPAPNKYQGLASAPFLAETGADEARRMPFAYAAPGGALARHGAVRLLPVALYGGADQQFGSLSAADKAELAAAAQEQFRAALARHGILAADGDADAVELQITLTGAQANIPVLATATKLTPAGFALNTVHAVADQEGRFTGVVIYAVEFRERASQRIVWAFITKQYPNAMNLAATLGPLDAAKEGLKEGAEKLAAATAARLRRP